MSLEALIRPKSIAVLGASDRFEAVGYKAMKALGRFGYPGTVYPVNPRRESIAGLTAYPSVSAIPDSPDCALIAVQKDLVVDAVRECGESGVAAAVIYTAGFAEYDEDGRQAQDELAQISSQTGIRLLGPNCQGIGDFNSRVVTNFSSALSVGPKLQGDIALVAQSGAVIGISYSEAQMASIGLGAVASVGNASDVSVGEFISYFSEREDISVIGCYLEGMDDFGSFSEGAIKARRAGKSVVVLRGGRSTQGVAAADSHTGRMVGDQASYDAALMRLGAVQVSNLKEWLDTANMLSVSSGFEEDPDSGITILSNSGGMGVMLSDAFAAEGIQLKSIPDSMHQALAPHMPGFVRLGNPIDASMALMDERFLHEFLKAAECELTRSPIVVCIGNAMVGSGYPINAFIQELSRAWDAGLEGLSILWVGSSPEVVDELRARRIPVFTDPGACVASISNRRRLALTRRRGVLWSTDQTTHLQQLLNGAAASQTTPRPLSSYWSGELLREYGAPMVDGTRTESPEEAAEAAERHGFPVVIKADSSALLHKQDTGGVILGLRTAEEVRSAAERLLDVGGTSNADLGVLVQPMMNEGVEMIVGAKLDPVFGPIVMVGLGGIFAELWNDVSVELAPVSTQTALGMIEDLRSAPLLSGLRGEQPRDVKAVAELITKISDVICDERGGVTEIDLNPVFVYAEGEGIIAVDALVVQQQ